MKKQTIFCPQDHLILTEAVCPVCGWQRPPQVPQGTLLWDVLQLDCGIGGPSSRPGIVNGIAVFPLRMGGMVAVNQVAGQVIWQSDPKPEANITKLQTFGDRLIAAAVDNRSIDQAGNAHLICVDPQTGEQEMVWEGYGFTITEPVLTDNLIIVRTAKSKLVALDIHDSARVVWEVPLKSYKPISPVVHDGLVFAWDGEISKVKSTLKTFELKTGKDLWQASIDEIDCAPAAAGGKFIYRSGKKNLTAISLENGEQLWRKAFRKIYSTPVIHGDRLFQVACGDENTKAAGYYSLMAIDLNSGDLIWSVPLGIRAKEILCLPDGNLLVGMGDRNLAICSSKDGKVLWQYSFGDEEVHRVQTHLIVKNGICWAGTKGGEIAAIQLGSELTKIPDPQDCLDKGDYEEAAIAFALTNQLNRAAKIYLEKLDQPRKALAIFDHLEDDKGRLKSYLKMGDDLSAACLLEASGNFAEAAKHYEEAEKYREAMQLYRKLGNHAEVDRVRKYLVLGSEDIDLLEEEGKINEAGDLAVKLKKYKRAIELYKQVPELEPKTLLNTYQLINELNPEEWSMHEMAEFARGLGKFLIQAETYESLKETDKAAIAYKNYAMQLETLDPSKKSTIAQMYDKACRLFDQEGLLDECEECLEKCRAINKLPVIQIYGKTEGAFRESSGWNKVLFTVENIGYGRSDEITFRILGEKFEFDEPSLKQKIEHLAAHKKVDIELYIRPVEGQTGEGVPLTIEWSWKDRNAKTYQAQTTKGVLVKSRDDSRTDNTPVTINATTYIAGDDNSKKIEGDNIEDGGQKGDRVEIHHDGHVKVIDEEYGELTPKNLVRKCPICSLEVDNDAEFCDKCGNKIN